MSTHNPPPASTNARHKHGGETPSIIWSGGEHHLTTLVRDHVQAAGYAFIEGGSGGEASVGIVCTPNTAPTAPTAPLILVSATPPTTSELTLALERHAHSIRELPAQSQQFLRDLLSLAPHNESHTSIAVVPGHGGAGASSLAARLAHAGARKSLTSTLVDTDPLSGGLDLLVEGEHIAGARWPTLAKAGSGNGKALRESLPEVDSVRILTWDPYEATPCTINPTPVIEALAETPGLLIIDSPAHAEHLGQWKAAHTLVVIEPSEHTLAASARRIAHLQVLGIESISLVLRHPRTGRIWKAAHVEEQLGCPVSMEFPSYPSNVVPLLDHRRGGADAACTRFIEQLGLKS